MYKELVAEMTRRGFVYYDWNVSSADAASSGVTVDSIYTNAMRGAYNSNRAIILMHDAPGRYTTVQALPRIINSYSELGYTFDSLSPEVKPITFDYWD